MTDDSHQEAQPASIPPPRRRAPPPRRGNGNGAVGQTTDDLITTLLQQNAEILARLERAESGGIRYVATEPEPQPDTRAVNPAALDPFTKRLWEERTRDTPQDYGGDREPPYNIPQRLYLKNDGSYALLQGDSRSRVYYTDKGFHCLSPDEVTEYAKIRPSIVAAQREKAHLVDAIVQLVHTDAALAGHKDKGGGVAFDIDLMTADQLRQKWQSLCAETSQPDRQLPPPKRWRSEGRDRQLDGVETTPSRNIVAEFETQQEQAAKSRRRGGRTIEVTAANARQFS